MDPWQALVNTIMNLSEFLLNWLKILLASQEALYNGVITYISVFNNEYFVKRHAFRL